ncbi:hypothetical protein PSPO01_12414 [Paraphaeosphaeria sporulosa]
MAPKKIEPSGAGKKRKSSVYSMDYRDMVQFEAGGETFTVPAAILDNFGREWRTMLTPNTGHAGQDFKNCPHTYGFDDCPTLVRAFLPWLHTGGLPTSSLIREHSFPPHWERGRGQTR